MPLAVYTYTLTNSSTFVSCLLGFSLHAGFFEQYFPQCLFTPITRPLLLALLSSIPLFLLPTAQCNHLPYIYFCFLCLQWQFMLKNRTLPFPTFCPPHPTWTTLNNSSCHYKWGDQSTSDSQCHIQTQRTGHLHLERNHRERIDIGR